AAPVLCLVAGATLALRLLPRVAALAERHAARSRRLVVPLAAWDVARRRHSGAGSFLLVLASAATVLALTGQATWARSQQDQAGAQVGAELVVTSAELAPLSAGPALAEATGGTPSAVLQRPVGLGSRAGGEQAGEPAQLLAVDLAGPGLQVGRPPPGTTWSQATAGAAPTGDSPAPVLLPVTDDLRVRLTGTVRDTTTLLAAPSLVVQDRWGDQAVLAGAPVPLDGRTHEVRVALGEPPGEGPGGGPGGAAVAAPLHVVAVRLALTLADGADPPATDRTARTAVEVELVGASTSQGAGPAQWSGAREPGDFQVVRNAAASQQGGADGVVLTATASVSPVGVLWEGGDLLVVAGPPVTDLPVVVTRALADGLGLEPGSRLSVTVGLSAVDAVVASVVPYLPAVSDGPAVLADRSTLARALLGRHDLAGLTDRWWVADVPDPRAATQAVADAGLGRAVTNEGTAAELHDGPLPRVLRLGTAVLLVAGIVLALLGTAARVAAAVGARAVEVARLLGLGLSRRSVLSAFVLEHAATSLVAVLAGTVVGAVVSWLTSPLLVVSSTGERPVPDAVLVWPATALAVAVAVLVLGSTAVVVPVAAAAVRRAGATHLRMDAAP
ncbi:FtsX-like permease family protein, partial [Actinotalea sp. JY-7885]